MPVSSNEGASGSVNARKLVLLRWRARIVDGRTLSVNVTHHLLISTMSMSALLHLCRGTGADEGPSGER